MKVDWDCGRNYRRWRVAGHFTVLLGRWRSHEVSVNEFE
jgi:hypothetical protein